MSYRFIYDKFCKLDYVNNSFDRLLVNFFTIWLTISSIKLLMSLFLLTESKKSVTKFHKSIFVITIRQSQ